jgi:DNA-binding NarL/FixJ family response regulator
MVAFREVILDYLRKKQARRCAQCGQRIEQYYQERIVYINEDCDGGCDQLGNLKLVHFDCKKAHRIVDTRLDKANQLLQRGMSVRQVSTILNVSERTVQRYVKRLRKKSRR